jgi:CcmD family protein
MSFLFAAFLIIWIGLFAYVVYWQRKVRDLRAEVEALRKLAEKNSP